MEANPNHRNVLERNKQKGMKMIYASVCSGVEAASLAWMPLGWKPAWFSEIEPFPCEVLKQRFPDVPNLGDMTKIKGEEYRGKIDLLVGGTPCFVAGTMVLTPSGYQAIETLKIGDEVITHTGDIRKVTAIGNKEAATGEVKIIGLPIIRCTGNHPFYSISTKRDNRRKSDTYGQQIPDGEYEFKAIEDSVGRYAGRIKAKCFAAHIPCVYQATPNDVMELAGWYIGDGYIRRWTGKSKKAVIIAAVCERKIKQFTERFDGVIKYSIGTRDGKITITNTVLADWLIENFGEKSQCKRIPYWLYASELKNSFIDGYEKTDGNHRVCGTIRITTTSAALAYGIADLYESASVTFTKRKPKHRICGRMVSQSDTYTVNKTNRKTPKTQMRRGRYASLIGGWKNDGAIRTVYNITVDGEHSYIVNGLAVHNCQGFSVAGKQGGLNDPRSRLCLSYCRLLETMRPRWFVWENVPGVFRTNKGEDFRKFIQTIDEIGYSLAWRVLDAQYVRVDGFPRAVPQRRRRVFVVGHLGADWRYPASVLFEPEILHRHTPPRRTKGAGVARCITGSTGGASGKEQQHTFIGGDGMPLNALGIDGYNGAVTGKVAATVDTNSKNVNGPTLVMATGQANAEVTVQHSPALNCNHEQPIVCAGFSGGQGAKAGGIGYCDEVAPTIRSAESGSNQVPDVICQYGDVAGTLTSRYDSSPCADRGQNIVFYECLTPGESQSIRIYGKDGAFPTINANENGGQNRQSVLCYKNHGQDSRISELKKGVAPQLNAQAGTGGGNLPLIQEVPSIAIAENIIGRKPENGGNGNGFSEELAYTQNATGTMGVCAYSPNEMTVRRLLPIECERLMGFPDGHTLIKWKGKPEEKCPDLHRYKACGNSMCVNVMRWIGMRIEQVERKTE